MKGVHNVVSLAMQRETHVNRRNGGIACKEMLAAAEEKAASCEMEEISCQLPENTRSTFLVTFSPDGTKVASAHGNHKIYVSDVRTGKCLHTLEGHPRTPWCIAFHPSYNDILASGCLGGEVRVWDLHGGCEVWTGEKNTAIASLAFHPTDHVLVIATTNKIYFWSWSLSNPFAWCKTASEKERVRFVRFDPYGHHLFTGIVNVTTVNRQREDVGRPVIACDREQEESNLHERLFLLNEQHRHLLHRLQELQSHASGTREEASAFDPVDRPPSPSVADALRMARNYAADFTFRQLQRETTQTSFSSAPRTEANRSSSSSSHSEPSTSRANLGYAADNRNNRNDASPRLSFQELQENLRSMRVRYTRICERLREVLMLRSRNSDDLTSSNASAANLVYSLLTFWREYETLAISLQQSSLHYSSAGEPNRDARRHIAQAMVSLLHLQEMLHSSLLHRTNDVSERGMARLIHSILMTLLELATLDTNILALRTTALEAIGRTMNSQLATSVQRPEARRQRGPSLNFATSSAGTSLPSISRMNAASWHSSGDLSSTTHQLAAFRHMQTGDSSAIGRPETVTTSAFSQPHRASSTVNLSGGNLFRAANSRTSFALRSLNLHSRSTDQYGDDLNYFVGNTDAGRQESANESGATSSAGSSNQQHNGQSMSQHREFQLNLSSTEQLLRSILEELLNLLGSTSSSVPNNASAWQFQNAANSTSSPAASSTSSGSNVGQPTPSFPASWYSYWNRIWNVRSNHLDIPEQLFVARATYRIQCWNFTNFQIPDISNAQTNIVVPECLIQNDANIEISADGRLLATLVPSSVLTYTLLAVHSLQPDTFGQCLYLWSFCSSVISISLSPLGRYVLVGLGSNRRYFPNHGGKLIIGQVLQLVEGRDEKKEYLQHVRTVELRGENRFDVSLNSMRWLPLPGEGLVYGTNRGDLRICRPRSCSDPWIKPAMQQSTTAPRRTYRDIVARVLARRTSLHHPSFTRLIFPTTNSTATQTESDSDSG